MAEWLCRGELTVTDNRLQLTVKQLVIINSNERFTIHESRTNGTHRSHRTYVTYRRRYTSSYQRSSSLQGLVRYSRKHCSWPCGSSKHRPHEHKSLTRSPWPARDRSGPEEYSTTAPPPKPGYRPLLPDHSGG